ncbi:MAG: magnesium transporter [Chthonomonadales bacterium]
MIKYLTELLGRRVVDADGIALGRVSEAIAEQGNRFPAVAALGVRTASGVLWVPFAVVDTSNPVFRLRVRRDELVPYEPKEGSLYLRRDILDKQIVDVHDYRVVRVNDVRLAPCGDRLCVIGVDAGFRALVRRAGIGPVVEALARLVGRPLQANLIGWDDVETFEPDAAGGGRIRLKVPHEKISRLHPADIADIVEQLDPQQRTEVIEALDVETAADTIEEMEDEEAAQVMAALKEEKAADILEEMDPDEAADVLGDLSNSRTEELLEHMAPEVAADVKELIGYDEETAGGLMTPEFIAIPGHLTAAQTIERLRELAPKAETIYYVYVVDEDGHLAGVISLRDLIVADPDTPIQDVMVRNVRYAHTSDHADDVAQVISRYNLLALPVVDEDHVLQGIITVDDIMERLAPPERRRKLPQVAVEEEPQRQQ